MRISSCLVLGNERCKIDLDGPKGKYGVVREKQNSCLNSLAGKKQTGRIAGARGMNSKGTSICTYLTLYFKVAFKYTRSVGEASDTPVRYLYRKYLRGVYCARKYLSLGSKAAPEKKITLSSEISYRRKSYGWGSRAYIPWIAYNFVIVERYLLSL